MTRPLLSIIDTPVLVAGLITSDVASPVARVVDGMLTWRVIVLASQRLLREYRCALLSPPVAARHGLGVAGVDALLERIERLARIINLGAPDAPPDPNDRMLWDLMSVRPPPVLVTFNPRLLAHPREEASARLPADFAALLN